jgi:hypothetical protein
VLNILLRWYLQAQTNLPASDFRPSGLTYLAEYLIEIDDSQYNTLPSEFWYVYEYSLIKMTTGGGVYVEKYNGDI